MNYPNELLLHCLNALEEPIFVVCRKDKKISFANAAFAQLIGVDAQSLVGMFITDFWATYQDVSGKEVTAALVRTSLAGQNALPTKETILVKMHRRILSEYTAEDSIGESLFKVVAAQLASATQELYHAQRLETLGMLAGAVAHDFNNVLTGILGHTTYLKAILPQSGPHIESLAAIEDGTKKGASITHQVLSFSKLDSVAGPVEVGLQELINKTLVLVRKAIPHRLKLETHYECGETWILAVEGQLMQALVNLVMNAKDAIADSGLIRVALTYEARIEKLKEVFNGADLAASRFVVLSVQDTGSGIPEEYVDRVFERYFTTKREKGTGLGLSTVFDIAQGLGGTVTLSSRVGVGTSISIYLPIHKAEEKTPSEPLLPRVQKGTESILIVDDEAPVRNILAVSLQHLGYKVTTSDSAVEAVERIKTEGLPYDLIISDMLMPGMSGDQFFAYLQDNHKDAAIPFLIISGFSAEGSVHRLLQAGAAGFLAKPFTIEELSKEVRKILDRAK